MTNREFNAMLIELLKQSMSDGFNFDVKNVQLSRTQIREALIVTTKDGSQFEVLVSKA